MKTHLQNITEHIPDLLRRKILDIGSGKGGFLIEAALKGGNVYGLEKNEKYIEMTLVEAKKKNVVINIKEGVVEALPFSDNEFGFLNISEVIEHVENPDKLISESYRTLDQGGYAYLSVPSRFSLKDTHFHLYFVNWFPRFMSELFITVFGKHKDYEGDAGEQRLSEMYYYRFYDIKRKLMKAGFKVVDIRECKIRKKFGSVQGAIMTTVYTLFLRPFYFDTFHILLKK